MIISASFSKPAGDCTAALQRPYIRIKAKSAVSGTEPKYTVELFTQKQAFHQTWTPEQLDAFISQHAGTTFLNCVYRTEIEETTILGNKKGHITKLTKAIKIEQKKHSGTAAKIAAYDAAKTDPTNTNGNNRVKNYLLKEGIPVPFLVHLGVMTPAGKVIASKYDKFRQINRFLEYIDDILPQVLQQLTPGEPLRITDFGCGKSYLTFAVYHFVTEIKKIPAQITGLDLKEDVITYCNNLAQQFGYTSLQFAVGDIAEYKHTYDPDIVITLHACDTATDYALGYAVKHNTKAIISVPCCQHEINQQLDSHKGIENTTPEAKSFAALLQYGIIKERFAALVTDALRAQYLEQAGYKVQMLEFIDMAHTPKNLLIRAVKRSNTTQAQIATAKERTDALTQVLQLEPTLKKLLG